MAAIDGATVDRPLVTPETLERRAYQTTLAEAALETHTLVCLPTGLGKTAVSLLVTADRLHMRGGKSLLLAPTKPLVTQHADFYREALDIPAEEVVVFTGEVRPDDRAAQWDDARVIIATPQVVENDLVGNRISLAAVTHLTFDECHRATGQYAYNYIAERYHADADDPLVTGMSASPGDDEEAILAVCDNLGIERVEVMTEADADVDAYTHETTVEWERIELPDTVVEIRDAVKEVIQDRMEQLRDIGVTNTTQADVSEREIQKIQGKVKRLMDDDDSAGYRGMSLLAEVRKLRTAATYVETQSVESFRRYMERQTEAARSSGASKADQRMVSEPSIKAAIRTAEAHNDLHPKFRRARMLIAETLGIQEGERVILFTESRDTAETLADFLADHFETARFVGQSDTDGSDGMTQAEQQETLETFRDGEYEVLVSTSVAEEGLDVPEVDLVLFYEPVPTAIRSIQRKGRTGRQTEGRVVVLLAEDTRDEAYFWKSRHDENRMEEELRLLDDAADEIESRLQPQASLDAAATDGAGETDDGDSDGRTNTPDGGTADRETTTEGPQSETEAGTGITDASGTETGTATTDTGPDERPGQGDDRTAPGGQSGLDAFAGGGTADEASTGRSAPPDGDDIAGDGPRATGTVHEGTSAPGADGDVAVPETDEQAAEIVVDQRELDSTIARDLSTREGIETRLETLAVGDYVVSDRVVVERKTIEDFLETLVGGDRSLFEQLGEAARHYGRPVVVIEGEGLYGSRNIHPKAINGALAAMAVDFGASVMQTGDEDETADLLEVLATREQDDGRREVSVHGEKQSKTLTEQQEYVVSAIAEVGPVTARSLLTSLGSVEAVMTADREALLSVEGVGEVTADRILEVVTSSYDGTV